MEKNLFSKEACEALVARVQNLNADTSPHWGKMTATEMLLHLNKVHAQLLTPAVARSNQKTTARQLIIRWLVLYIMPHYPRGAKTPRQLNTKGTISKKAFEEQQQLFADTLRRFANHTELIEHFHPYFGALSTRQWGLSSWKHADHHLRQFGL